MKALNDLQEERAAKFAEFRELAALERDFDEDEQAKYDRLLAEVQELDKRCRDWHRIPQKSGRTF